MTNVDYARIHDPERTEHVVYRLLSPRGRTLYIGCTMDLESRVRVHRKNARFGHRIANVVTLGPFNYQDARRLEAELILTEKPAFNSEWKSRTYFSRGRLIKTRGRRLPEVSA